MMRLAQKRLFLTPLFLFQCCVALASPLKNDFRWYKEPWECLSKLLNVLEYVRYPTKIVWDQWHLITSPSEVKKYNHEAFLKAKSFYSDGNENALLVTPETFEEKLAFIETYSEKTGDLPLKLGEILEKGPPKNKKILAKLLNPFDLSKGLSEAQVFNLLVKLYKVQYRSPSKFWKESSIDRFILQRLQVELMSKTLTLRLNMMDQLVPQSIGEKIRGSAGFQYVLSAVIAGSAVAAGSYVPVYLPELKKLRIPSDLLTEIERDGPDTHQEKLKELLGNKVKWGIFYEQFRKRYLLAAGAYTVTWAYANISQLISEKQLRDPIREQEIADYTLKILGLNR